MAVENVELVKECCPQHMCTVAGRMKEHEESNEKKKIFIKVQKPRTDGLIIARTNVLRGGYSSKQCMNCRT